ncbi:hypothetical protein FALBO_141 [Fusarium albosuccineum]|uniref:Uncharacterized protein n=1 Tax=Fusarium albosuccineum TaxID=1237068 RepID=A0A8H4PIH8_9HYPO|nr:hypothetical protein FALBO_141 [Fusarium albosuccineum]
MHEGRVQSEEEVGSRWNEAETWTELLSLNAQYIRQSRRSETEPNPVSSPFRDGPREDCIGATDDYMQSVLDLHKYGILSIDGSPGFNEFDRKAVEVPKMCLQSRSIPYIHFIIRDVKGKTGRFFKRLLEDERLVVEVLDGFSGQPEFGTDYKQVIFEIYRDAEQEAGLKRAQWKVEKASSGDSMDIEDYILEETKAIQKVKAADDQHIYVCFAAMKVPNDTFYCKDDGIFSREVGKIDLLRVIQKYAKEARMGSMRSSLLGRLWVGRGLLSVGRTYMMRAVLKPTGGFDLALRKRLDRR